MHGETWPLPPVRQHDEVALDTPLERFVLNRDRNVSEGARGSRRVRYRRKPKPSRDCRNQESESRSGQ